MAPSKTRSTCSLPACSLPSGPLDSPDSRYITAVCRAAPFSSTPNPALRLCRLRIERLFPHSADFLRAPPKGNTAMEAVPLRTLFSCVAFAFCSACASGSAIAPPDGMLDAAHLPALAHGKATGKYFEYIINNYGTYASIFNYPKSTEQIGTIRNVGGQGCTNVLYGYGKK